MHQKFPGRGEGRGAPSTMTPRRLGGVAQSLLSGDTVKAACASAGVAQSTYQHWLQQGMAAMSSAQTELEIEDLEGHVWEWLENDHGGPGSASPNSSYWSADPPEWWPQTLVSRWTHVVFLVVVYWARGQAERVYRQVITTAARQGDWKAAEFMLTHSFGWAKQNHLEVTGADGGPLEVQHSDEAALAALAALADRRKAIEE